MITYFLSARTGALPILHGQRPRSLSPRLTAWLCALSSLHPVYVFNNILIPIKIYALSGFRPFERATPWLVRRRNTHPRTVSYRHR